MHYVVAVSPYSITTYTSSSCTYPTVSDAFNVHIPEAVRSLRNRLSCNLCPAKPFWMYLPMCARLLLPSWACLE